MRRSKYNFIQKKIKIKEKQMLFDTNKKNASSKHLTYIYKYAQSIFLKIHNTYTHFFIQRFDLSPVFF